MASRTVLVWAILRPARPSPMHYIALPISIRTMKRTRGLFIAYVAEELGEA